MNYIVFDLEFNQANNKFEINPKLPFEIIQLGAIVFDEKFNILNTVDSLIKPEVYTSLNPYVENLTGISYDELSIAKSFKEVFRELMSIFNDESILCVWGVSDIKELYRNSTYYNLNTDLLPTSYINVQRQVSKHLKLGRGINLGLNSAVEIFDIPTANNFHNAFNDAFYTLEVFKKIYSDKLTPKKYIFNNIPKRIPSNKTILDKIALFNQFEKMFEKELTLEEKSMIELAYKMGKTNQFQIHSS